MKPVPIQYINNSQAEFIYDALAYLPKEVRRKVRDECYFVFVKEGLWGLYTSRQAIEARSIIHLMLPEDACPLAVINTVLHEIAHHHLQHTSGTDKEAAEKEADEQVWQWLEPFQRSINIKLRDCASCIFWDKFCRLLAKESIA